MSERQKSAAQSLLPIKIKPLTPSELNFVIDSWLKSYRQTSWAKLMPNSVYFPHHRKLVESTLARATCLVAVNPEDEDQTYGYAVFEKAQGLFILHYMFTKEIFRKLAVAKRLIVENIAPDEELIYTHHTPYTRGVLKRLIRPKYFTYNPYWRQ